MPSALVREGNLLPHPQDLDSVRFVELKVHCSLLRRDSFSLKAVGERVLARHEVCLFVGKGRVLPTS